VIILTEDDRMLLATCAIIVSISLLTTFVGNSASAQSTTTGTSPWLEGTSSVETGTNTTETEQSESLNVEGLSRQGADDLAIVCAFFPEQCSMISQSD
jgi:hypothetical protein